MLDNVIRLDVNGRLQKKESAVIHRRFPPYVRSRPLTSDDVFVAQTRVSQFVGDLLQMTLGRIFCVQSYVGEMGHHNTTPSFLGTPQDLNLAPTKYQMGGGGPGTKLYHFTCILAYCSSLCLLHLLHVSPWLPTESTVAQLLQWMHNLALFLLLLPRCALSFLKRGCSTTLQRCNKWGAQVLRSHSAQKHQSLRGVQEWKATSINLPSISTLPRPLFTFVYLNFC